MEVAGAYAMYDGPRSPCTQTFGLGLFRIAAVRAETVGIDMPDLLRREAAGSQRLCEDVSHCLFEQAHAVVIRGRRRSGANDFAINARSASFRILELLKSASQFQHASSLFRETYTGTLQHTMPPNSKKNRLIDENAQYTGGRSIDTRRFCMV